MAQRVVARVVVGVAAGKGGVGKSTLCCQMARAAQKLGYTVAILDADIHGPSMDRLMPLDTPPSLTNGQVLPGRSAGVQVMSAAFIPRWRELAAVRAPIANALIAQFLEEVEWGNPDLLLIDFPPGTGDVPITLFQKAHLAGIVAITTPQALAVQDVRKSLKQASQASIPILGLVENMAGLQSAEGWTDLFGSSQASDLVHEFQIPELLQWPFDPGIASLSDRGAHLYETGYPSSLAPSLLEFVQRILQPLYPGGEGTCLEGVELSKVKILEGLMLELCTSSGGCRRIDVRELLNRCPCVRCASARAQAVSSEAGSPALKEPVHQLSLLDSPGIRGFRQVGTFGISLDIERGCSQGIYPWRLLHTLGNVCCADG